MPLIENEMHHGLIIKSLQYNEYDVFIVKLRQRLGKDWQGMAVKAKGLKALTLA